MLPAEGLAYVFRDCEAKLVIVTMVILAEPSVSLVDKVADALNSRPRKTLSPTASTKLTTAAAARDSVRPAYVGCAAAGFMYIDMMRGR